MKIIAMRHGETDWNRACKLQGRTDIPLNEAGKEMAEEAGKRLSEEKIDLCITSPLVRAEETAALILKENRKGVPEQEEKLWPSGSAVSMHGCRFFTDPRLIEYCFGEWEGKIFKGPGYELPVKEYGDYWEPMDDSLIYPGMEGKKALVRRVRSFLDELTDRYGKTDKTILFVAHGGVLRAVKMIADDATLSFKIRVPANCGRFLLEPDEEAAFLQEKAGIREGSLKYGRRLKLREEA